MNDIESLAKDLISKYVMVFMMIQSIKIISIRIQNYSSLAAIDILLPSMMLVP